MFKKILLILISLIIVLSVCYYNAVNINTKQIKVREEIIESDKFDSSQDGLLIAYFTDLHYTNYINNEFLDKVISKINQFEPDVILFGGDLIDNYETNDLSSEDRQYLIDSLSSLYAPYGKYAVLGNHDCNNAQATNSIIEILTESGFTMLTNDNTVITTGINSQINIVGIDSMVGGTPDASSAFSNINTNNYTFVLSHCPDTFSDLESIDFDYMLAGHSHGGQVYIPLVSDLKRPVGCQQYFRGKHTSGTKTLDISNGVGRTLMDARFLADAEIVMYRLQSTKIDTVTQSE